MNICEHPSVRLDLRCQAIADPEQYMDNHGMLIEKKNAETHPKPHTKLFPLFVPSKTILNGDIPVTPIGRDGRRDDVGTDPPWNKKSGKLYWVGTSVGISYSLM